MLDIPFDLGEVSADWLSSALNDSGELNGRRVVGLDTKIVGEGAGFMGHVAMLGLTLAPPSATPMSLVLKIPTDTDNRHIGQTVGVYEREIRFYQELQPHMQVRTPRHIYSAMDQVTNPEMTVKALKFLNRLPIWLIRKLVPMFNWLGSRSTARYVLLMESLEDCRIGDQVGGCSAADARRVLDTMAKMHAQFWHGRSLDRYPWLLSVDLSLKPFHMMYLQAVDQFKQAHCGWLTRRNIAALDWLKDHYFDLMARFRACPETLIHGDFRLDNLCFDDETGDVILFDWQTLGRGPCGFDLAYFLSASFASPLSRDEMNGLIAYYGERLAQCGAETSPAALRWQYEAGLLAVLHRVIPAQFQDMLDLGDGRGVELIDSWLERGFRALDDVDPERVLNQCPAMENQ